MKVYDALKRPPVDALKKIGGGRLSGMTDINPQWRYTAMTEQFGVCGIGWKYTIDRLWTETMPDGQIMSFANVSVYIKSGESWSDPIPGNGGSMLYEKEKSGMHASDEGYKMAITDAMGTAMKMLGVAGDIYAGRWDGSKYKDKPVEKSEFYPDAEFNKNKKEWENMVVTGGRTAEQILAFFVAKDIKLTEKQAKEIKGWKKIDAVPANEIGE